MSEYALLQVVAWVVLGAVMVLFSLTGGFDLGAGVLLPFLGKTNQERRVVVNIVGPTWDGNQVWLIIIGAGIFAVWPRAYAASFSGFYFAMLIVLWGLFLRPVSFEYRSKLPSQSWRTFWDWTLCIGSTLPAVIFGVAMGNLLLGSPFSFDPMSLRLDYTGSFFGLLHPFALLCGVLSLLMFLMHGAAYLLLRSEGRVYERSRRAVMRFSVFFLVVYCFVGIVLAFVLKGYHLSAMPVNPTTHPLTSTVVLYRGAWMDNYYKYPWMLIAPLLGLLSAVLVYFSAKQEKRKRTFFTSTLAVTGTVVSIGFSLFPFLMPSSTHPDQSLLVWNSASSQRSLEGILWVAAITLPIIFIYTTFVYRKLWGRGQRMSEGVVSAQDHVLY